MNTAQEHYIHELNVLASGAALEDIPAITKAIECVERWDLDGAVSSLSNIDTLRITTWHDRLLDVYCDLRVEGR